MPFNSYIAFNVTSIYCENMFVIVVTPYDAAQCHLNGA